MFTITGPVTININGLGDAQFQQLMTRLDQSLKKEQQIMAAIDDLKTAQAAEKADLVTLSGLVVQILTVVANGSLSAADAQALLDEINSQDTSIKANIASIQAALTPATPPPPGP